MQESRQEARTPSGRRLPEGAGDTVDVTARAQRPAAPAAASSFAVADEASARWLVQATTDQIVAEPALAARAQANGNSEGVLAMLR